jgi:hypothetical protein
MILRDYMKFLGLAFSLSMFVGSSTFAFTFYSPPTLTPEQSGAMPDITGKILSGYRESAKAAALKSQLQENLYQARLQNQLLAIRLKMFLDSHPKIAKDLADSDEAKRIIESNKGIKGMFKSNKTNISELRQCAKHGNTYCKIMVEKLNNHVKL